MHFLWAQRDLWVLKGSLARSFILYYKISLCEIL